MTAGVLLIVLIVPQLSNLVAQRRDFGAQRFGGSRARQLRPLILHVTPDEKTRQGEQN
jgi:hypothetical protein